jgi:hypothetical protein
MTQLRVEPDEVAQEEGAGHENWQTNPESVAEIQKPNDLGAKHLNSTIL